VRDQELVPHLFRTEYSKIVAVLVRRFGLAQMEIAEDIAGETFASAVESWSFAGPPENPSAWLYAVAKNKARNYLSRLRKFRETPFDEIEIEATEESLIDLSEGNISDSQLRMIFAICHPSLSIESQVALALRILCGFGIEEIANAFLTSKETINKRLFRAKETLRRGEVRLEVPQDLELEPRLGAVLATLYLLFSEGYFSECHATVLREDLCHEAMRLTEHLLNCDTTNLPQTRALLALMCFHASRFPARRCESGEMVLYEDQDPSLWNTQLISRGAKLLHEASCGNTVTKYHVEASIAFWHCMKEDTLEKWENISMLYDVLLQIDYSPMAALNRTYALSRVKGNAAAVVEAEKLQLTSNHFYFTLLGELYTHLDPPRAQELFRNALSLAKRDADKATIRRKLDLLG
jgi:RNA polymerase sigma-70 factor (ECF subfamily)